MANSVVRLMGFTRMDNPRMKREGETAFSPKRQSESTDAPAKEGVHGGTTGSPVLNIVKAVLAASES